MLRTLLFIILSVFSMSVFAQNYRFKAEIETVIENSFYKILLSPEITAQLNSQFTDIRLYSNKTEIPYILYEEFRLTEKELFVEYEITEIKHNKAGRFTRVVIHNADANPINNIVLRVKNADVRKRLKLNASNNQKDWFVLKNNYAYNSIYNTENTSEIRVLNFPLSNYEYYELLIDDYYDKPINILKAGYYNRTIENGKYTQLKAIGFSKIDTLKETIIAIPVNGNYIDKIDFEIDAPKYFYRYAEIYINGAREYKNQLIFYEERVQRIKLVSNSSNAFSLNNLKTDTIFIRIQNNDDLSLKIKNIGVYQLNKYITAELNPQNTYYLKYGDLKAEKPIYDLAYFADSIPHILNVIGTKPPSEIANLEGEKYSEAWNFSNYWLWISIIVIALLLSYMSFKMVKENKIKDE